MKLREAVENEKKRFIKRLISMNFLKMADGRQLYELTLTELQETYEKLSN